MSCKLCGETKTARTLQVGVHLVNCCDGCGLFYVDDYQAADDVRHDDDINPEKQYCYETLFYNRYFDLIKAHVGPTTKVLDIGCGTGRLLELLKDKTSHRTGIELNSERQQMAVQKADCEILGEPIETFSSEERFDVIVLSNVFSHLDLRYEPFQKIMSHLNPKGKLILITGELAPTVEANGRIDWGLPEHRQFLGFNTIDTFCSQHDLKKVTHHRQLFSEELFSKDYFLSPGRSTVRNILKKIILYTPFALKLGKYAYDKKHSKTVFTSFFCLEKSA